MVDFLKKKYGFKSIVILKGGYSFCDKYLADNFVVKVYGINELETLKKRKKFMVVLREMGLLVTKIIDIGVFKEQCYSVVEFIQGDSGESIIEYDKKLHYSIGLKAGKQLKKIHSVKCDEKIDIFDLQKKKIQTVYREFKKLKISFEHEKIFINYINNNISKLKGRTANYLHGDFHLENIAFDNSGYKGAFDFERFKITDYVREFERICFFSRGVSVEFTRGVFEGYEFEEYDILKLYLAMSIFNSLVWAKKYYPDQLEMFKRLSSNILDDYDNFSLQKPKYVGEGW